MDDTYRSKLESIVLDFIKVWIDHEAKSESDMEYVNLITAVFTFKHVIRAIVSDGYFVDPEVSPEEIMSMIDAQSKEIAQSIINRQKITVKVLN